MECLNANKKTYPNKTCNKCNLTVTYKNWSRHLKSIRHEKNDTDQTIKTRFNKPHTRKTRKERIPKPHKVFNFNKKIY